MSLIYRRVTVWLGFGLIAAGLLVNRFTLAALSPDGSINGWRTNLIIVVFQLAMISYGVYAVRFQRGYVVEFCLVLASLWVAFLLLEVLWRVHLFGGATFSYDKMNSLQSVGEAGMLRASDRPGIVFELRPGLDQYFKLVEFRTNSVGMRDREHNLAKPPGALRIAVLGDSFTMASGVEIEKAYPALLESRFNQGSRAHVEVLNFGVGGYALIQYLAVIREKALAYDPDLIIIGFCPENDYQLPPIDFFERPFVPRPRVNVFWRSHVHQFIDDLRHSVPPAPVSPEESEYIQETFAAIGETAKAAGVPVVVAYLANRPSDVSLVRSLVTQSGLYFVNAGQAIMDGDLRDYSIYYPMDTHPNGTAHRAFADAIYDFLVTAGLPSDHAGG